MWILINFAGSNASVEVCSLQVQSIVELSSWNFLHRYTVALQRNNSDFGYQYPVQRRVERRAIFLNTPAQGEAFWGVTLFYNPPPPTNVHAVKLRVMKFDAEKGNVYLRSTALPT